MSLPLYSRRTWKKRLSTWVLQKKFSSQTARDSFPPFAALLMQFDCLVSMGSVLVHCSYRWCCTRKISTSLLTGISVDLSLADFSYLPIPLTCRTLFPVAHSQFISHRNHFVLSLLQDFSLSPLFQLLASFLRPLVSRWTALLSFDCVSFQCRSCVGWWL